MQDLYRTLSELLTNVSSNQRYSDPKNSERIESQIKQFANLAHELKSKEVSSKHPDASIRIYSDHLSEDANEAYRSFREGRKEYARGLIRSLSSSCVACHSRSSVGPQFGALPLADFQVELKAIEKAQFFSASRQFDRAETEYLKIVKDDAAVENSPWDWEEAVHQSLSIAVRVKKDPALASSIANTLITQKSVPFYMKEYAKVWIKSIDQWKAKPISAKTESGIFQEAKRLLVAAQKTQKYANDRSADILYLRASVALFDLLAMAPNGKHQSEALYMIGFCNESINPRNFDDLSELFYEECITSAPHTKTAQTCFQRYEQRVHFAFTGSSGTRLPTDVKQKISKLKTMATPR